MKTLASAIALALTAAALVLALAGDPAFAQSTELDPGLKRYMLREHACVARSAKIGDSITKVAESCLSAIIGTPRKLRTTTASGSGEAWIYRDGKLTLYFGNGVLVRVDNVGWAW